MLRLLRSPNLASISSIRAYDAGNISDEIEIKDAGNYSSISSFTDGNIGIGVTADSNRWRMMP